MNPIRVLIADDHPMFLLAVRTSLAAAEDIEIVGEAGSGAELLRLVATRKPDLVLIDYGMPQPDGLACLAAIKATHPEVKVAMLSGRSEPVVVDAAIRQGACAFIRKSIDPVDLAGVVRQLVSGTVVLFGPAAQAPAQRGPHPTGELTERELTILEGLARGLSNQAIARELWVAEPTVKFHVRNIYRKLGVANRTEAAPVAIEHGLAGSTPELAVAAV